MTRVLFDALTPKQARLAALLYLEGARRGIEVVITCRDYLHLADVLNTYGAPHICFGSYGLDVREKLLRGLERQWELAKIGDAVDGAVGFPSPDAARVIFGLGKPLVVLNDTPHAVHVNRLVLPLAEVLITPAAVPVEEWRRYCPRRLVTFNGLFEYMWTSRFIPRREEVEKLGLTPGEYVVFRPEESHAAYYRWNMHQLRMELVKFFVERGFTVVNVPRYGDQLMDGVMNLTRAVDHLQLAYFSAGVVTGGSTMATESVLLGVPALSYFPHRYYIDEFLQRVGAPLYRCSDVESCMSAASQLAKTPRGGLLKLEDPTDVIFEEISSVMR